MKDPTLRGKRAGYNTKPPTNQPLLHQPARKHTLPLAGSALRGMVPDLIVLDPMAGVGLERQPNGRLRVFIGGQETNTVFPDADSAVTGLRVLVDIARAIRDGTGQYAHHPAKAASGEA